MDFGNGDQPIRLGTSDAGIASICKETYRMSVKIHPSPTIEHDDLIGEGGQAENDGDSAFGVAHRPTRRGNVLSRALSAIGTPMYQLHRRTPLLRRLPSFVIFPIAILVVINLLIWAVAAIILRYHP